jgi:hypothetical protein
MVQIMYTGFCTLDNGLTFCGRSPRELPFLNMFHQVPSRKSINLIIYGDTKAHYKYFEHSMTVLLIIKGSIVLG